ncbi:MAG: regulatory protein RecX [Gammaproteobacteria bacterium]|nr:regulatory protein RecX [Gammaproteobacteria bacterium]
MRYPQGKSYSNRSDDVQNIDETPESLEHASTNSPKPHPTGAKLRGIAFAMLGRREHSEQEFKQKLLDLDADPDEVAALIKEFKTSQYQSDQRMAEMIVRANVRKGRGPARVKQTLRERSVDLELAQENLADTDWLTLARTLRVKKFGTELPTDPKEKARQLRFLQYRGFDMQTCIQAISSNQLEQ